VLLLLLLRKSGIKSNNSPSVCSAFLTSASKLAKQKINTLAPRALSYGGWERCGRAEPVCHDIAIDNSDPRQYGVMPYCEDGHYRGIVQPVFNIAAGVVCGRVLLMAPAEPAPVRRRCGYCHMQYQY
jgi:hypothetical protein